MKLKRLALTALTATLLALGAPATAHAEGSVQTRCYWITAEEYVKRLSPEDLALLKELGALPSGPRYVCGDDSSGNGWGP